MGLFSLLADEVPIKIYYTKAQKGQARQDYYQQCNNTSHEQLCGFFVVMQLPSIFRDERSGEGTFSENSA